MIEKVLDRELLIERIIDVISGVMARILQIRDYVH
jgi:hypothetical protein